LLRASISKEWAAQDEDFVCNASLACRRRQQPTAAAGRGLNGQGGSQHPIHHHKSLSRAIKTFI
jgi:hypothetical protein